MYSYKAFAAYLRFTGDSAAGITLAATRALLVLEVNARQQPTGLETGLEHFSEQVEEHDPLLSIVLRTELDRLAPEDRELVLLRCVNGEPMAGLWPARAFPPVGGVIGENR